MARPLEDVYCTLLMSDSYLPGVVVLAHSLRDSGTKKKLAVLITLETLSADTITVLKGLYDYVIPVEHIRNPTPANLYLMGRPDLAFAFTKIALWRQVQFRKIVYLDADVVALRALDELFDLDVPFAAAPDVGWPDAFNSGVMVIAPNMGDYWALHNMAAAGDSFDGADQGLLNQYYQHRNWHRLSFTYNCTPNAQYQWEPAYRYYKTNISAVHFIGKDKPWSAGRKGSGGPGVYTELLARWWAVHDKHYKAAAAQGLSAGAGFPYNTGRQIWGEAPTTNIATSQAQTLTSIPGIFIESYALESSTEPPLSDYVDVAEVIDQGLVEPISTVQQRRFSAPQMDWDATKSGPPAQSKPEAENFPHDIYEFNESHELFQAPHSYPEPPKDMWFKLPETRHNPTEQPRAIFPWEHQPDRPKATRVFAEDLPQSPTPAAWAVPAPTHQHSHVHFEDEGGAGSEDVQSAGLASPERASTPLITDAFQQSSVNAWDTVPGIDHYVRAIMDSQSRRAKPQVPYTPSETTENVTASIMRKSRRESLIITDFPSEIERPSLPVTPAPRPTTFWGQEEEQPVELAQAEGVPDQASWNPEEQLEQLRRSSLLEFEHLKKDVLKSPPMRELPEHSVPGKEELLDTRTPFGLDGTTDEKPTLDDKPVFQETGFGRGSADGKTEEDVLSPTAEQ